jgi:hypothetical protein
LLEGVLRLVTVGGIAGDGPGAGGFGDEGVDEFGAGGVAKEGLVAQEEEGGDGFSFGQAGEELLVGDARHAKGEFTWFGRWKKESRRKLLTSGGKGRLGDEKTATSTSPMHRESGGKTAALQRG